MKRIAIQSAVGLSVFLTAISLAFAAQPPIFTWNVDDDGNWNVPTNWDPNTGFPNETDSIVNLTFDITADRTVTIPAGSGVTIGVLNIGDPIGNFGAYNLVSGGGGGTLTFATSGDPAAINKAATASTATDIISAPIILNNDLILSNSALNAGLTISGPISESGGPWAITKLGEGLVTLSGTRTYTGDTVINAGTLAIAGVHTSGRAFTIASTSESASATMATGTLITKNINNGAGVFFVGEIGNGTMTQSGGTIQVSSFAALGREAGSIGNYIMSDGAFTVAGDFNVGDYGRGTLNMTGGSITTNSLFVVGYQASSTGNQATINGDNAVVTSNSSIRIGNLGKGTLDLMKGTLRVTGSGDLFIGFDGDTDGVFNQSGGLTDAQDWTYVGYDGKGAFNMTGGHYEAGHNFGIGQLNSGDGDMTISSGTLKVAGNKPTSIPQNFGTGNLGIGRYGNGTLVVSGDATIILDAVASGAANTYNSVSYSTFLNIGIPGGQLINSKDANLFVGERYGVGEMTQSGGKVEVGANVFVGGAEFVFNEDGDFEGMIGGKGTLNISGGELIVGKGSPTGGDLILGTPADLALSSATVNLSGGLLDVSRSAVVNTEFGPITFGGNIASGGGGTLKFNFTGGTLRVRVWNDTSAGDSLDSLIQNGTGSLLDVTGTSTTINSDYELGTGTASVGVGRTLMAHNIVNLDGAGVITVGNNGANAFLTVGNGSIDVDTLNLKNGVVTSNGGVTVRTKIAGKGTVNGNTVLTQDAILEPGNSAGMLHFSNNLTLEANTQMVWELGALSTTGAGTNFDFVQVDGDLNLGTGAELVLDFSLLSSNLQPGGGDAFWNASHTWKIIDAAANSGSTDFADILGGIGPGTWSTSIGTEEDLGDILLHYTFVALQPGDFDGNGFVGSGDLDLVLGNWGKTTVPASWVNFIPANFVGSAELDAVLGNWGEGTPPGQFTLVPEPGSYLLGLVAFGGLMLLRRRRGARQGI